MAEQDGGKLVYEVDIDVAPLLSGSNKAKAELASLGDAANDTAPGFEKLSKGAKGVASALAMPEVNKLSTKLAQLSGKIGASSESAMNAAVSQEQFHGALSTVSSQLGAGYISNVGSATASLIKHAKEAIAATNAQLENAVAAKKEATALQESATQLVIKATAEKKLAEEATNTATSELKVAEAVFARKEADIASLEALLVRQKESLRQSEANLEITNSEKAVAQALRDRNAVETTQAKIIKQSNQAVKEVTAAEDRVVATKAASAAASEKLTQSVTLEAVAVATVAKANDVAVIATEKLTFAAKAQAVAVTGARNAISLLGGPSGILLLAAAGVYALYQAMKDNTSIDDYRSKVDEAVKKLDELTAKQAKAASGQAGLVIKADTKELDNVGEKISIVQAQISYMEQNPFDWMQNNPFKNYDKVLDGLKNKLVILGGEQDDLTVKIGNTSTSQEKLNKAAEAGPVATGDAAKSAKILSDVFGTLAKQQEVATSAANDGAQAAELLAYKQELENRYLQQGIQITDGIALTIQQAVEKKRELYADVKAAGFKKSLKDIQDNVEALKIEMTQGAEAAAIYRAEMALRAAGVTDPKEAKEWTDAVREQYKAQKKLSESKKKDGGASKASGGLAKQQNQAVALRREYELLTSGTTDVARSMAIFNAVQGLGAKATAKQKEEAAEEAATVFDLKQKVDDFRKAAEITPELKISKAFADESEQLRRLFAEGLIDENTFREMGAKAKESFMAGMAEVKSDAVVSPMQEAVGKVDPVQALANENAKKIALINQFEQQKLAILQQSNMQGVITAQQYEQQKLSVEQQALALRNAANTQYEQARTEAQWEIWRNQSTTNELMASAVDGFASEASSALTGLINGTQSASEAFQNLGNSILNSVIQALVEVGIQYLKNAAMAMIADKMQANSSSMAATQTATAWAPAAAAASIATFGGAAVAGIAGMVAAYGVGIALAGKRKNGGPVSAGSMYQVGEGGMPEIYQASNGSQYMIPGDNGKVISNKDMQGGGGIVIHNNIQNYSSAMVDSQARMNSDGSLTIDTIIADINSGGPIDQAFTRNHHAPRKATDS